jgi:hypothetical protein
LKCANRSRHYHERVIDEDFLTPHDVIEDADHFGGRAGGTEPSELIVFKMRAARTASLVEPSIHHPGAGLSVNNIERISNSKSRS